MFRKTPVKSKKIQRKSSSKSSTRNRHAIIVIVVREKGVPLDREEEKGRDRLIRHRIKILDVDKSRDTGMSRAATEL
jgi:hypothetical protein